MPSFASYRRRGLAAAAAVTVVLPHTAVAQESLQGDPRDVPQGTQVHATSKYNPQAIEFVLATDATLLDGTRLPAGTSLRKCTDQASLLDCRYNFDFAPGAVVNLVYTYATYSSTIPVTVGERPPEVSGEDMPVVNDEFDAGEYSIEYPKSFARLGGKATSFTPTATRLVNGVRYENQPLPKGTEFRLIEVSAGTAEVDKSTGRVTLTAPATRPAVEPIAVTIEATYPDKSTGIFTALFNLDERRQKDVFTPAYEANREVVPGGTIMVRQTARDLPKDVQFYPYAKKNVLNGWTVSMDVATGDLIVTAPKENAEPLDFTTVAIYSDGSRSTLTTRIGIKGGTATAAEREVTFPPVSAATAADEGGNRKSVTPDFRGEVPEGTEFELVNAGSLEDVEVDKQTGELTFTRATGTDSDPVDPVVKVTYPDGSASTVTVPLEVERAADGSRMCRVEASSTSSVKECVTGIIGIGVVLVSILSVVVGAARIWQDYLPEQLRPYLPKGW